jgi:site-specific recombinase XerD
MNALALTMNTGEAITPDAMALMIKKNVPTLADLTQEQLLKIAQIVATQSLVNDMQSKVNLAGIDWNKEKQTFLNDAKSDQTRRAYTAALDRLEAWTARQRIDPLTMSAIQADQFIRDLKAGHIPMTAPAVRGRRPLIEGASPAPASSRRDIAAVSAFYSFLERYHTGIKNPIRGTRIRPPNETHKEAVIPTETDYETIIAAVPPIERAIIQCLALRGLRAGALPTLEKKGERYHGKSKGKILMEGERKEGVTMPKAAVDALKEAGLESRRPFTWTNSAAIERRVNYHIGKLYKAGHVTAPYSCHDFRHFFAKNEYQKDRDILRVSRLLNHSSVTITQGYLRTIGVEL